jgi:hypothetical protein
MAASSTSRFCLVSKEDIERLIDNANPDKIFTKTIRLPEFCYLNTILGIMHSEVLYNISLEKQRPH